MTPASIIPVFGSQRPYADLNFAGGSFGLDGRSVSDLTALPGFTFTRASLAMGYDATGKLTYGPNNLCLQSQTLDNASWTGANRTVTANTSVAPDGTTTADTVAGTGAGGTLLRQDVAVPGVATVLVSFYVKADTATTCMIYDVNIGPQGVFNLSTGAVISGAGATISSAGNGWYRCVVSYSPVGGFARVTINPGSTFNPITTSAILVWGAQYEAVTYQTTPSTYYPTTTAAYYGPRLVYDPVTLASQGILVEEARTNLCLQSSDFATTWTVSGATIGANAATSPDGTSNADGIVEDGASSVHRISQAVSVVSGTAYTLSVFVKVANVNFIQLVFGTPTYFPAGNGAWFNVSTGVVVSTGTSTTSAITSVGSGWYRCSITVTAVGTGSVSVFLNPSDNSSSATYTGTNGRTNVYLFGGQLEAGTGASSPIPTTTASVTRAADDAVMTGLSVPDGCTVMFEALAPAFVSTDARMSLSTNSTANRIWWLENGTAILPKSDVASVGVLAGSGASVAASAAIKAAISSVGGRYGSSVNGGAVETASGATMPTLTQLDIGKNAGSSLRYWNSPIKRIRIYNRALPDAQLQSLTT